MSGSSFLGLPTRLAAGVAVVTVLAVVALLAFRVPHAPQAPDFTLTDQNGRPFVLSAHRGESIALFFGYTHCPDVCPTTMAALARAKRSLGARANAFDAVFVTVDPARDTPAVLKRYVRNFDPTFVGLTGTQAQLDPVLAAYHVYHQNLPADRSGNYPVAHSSTIDFIDGSGRLRTTADWSDTPAQLAGAIEETLS